VRARPGLAALAVESCEGQVLASAARDAPLDRQKERVFTVRRSLSAEDPSACPDGSALVVATFAAPAARFDELESAQSFVQAYHQLERRHREEYLEQTYVNVFFVVVGLTILLAMAAGVLVARPVTRRIARLAAATEPVARGDLSVRVDLGGDDEVSDLGGAFNHMLEELERTRARIEFLKRIGEWQKMARRLAHEIKNPLTPIQLAVEECHRRYPGDDPAYKRILQTTFEVVQEEVGTLRRLVSEFSSFARLPRAELVPADLGEFLREQQDHFAMTEAAGVSQTALDDLELYGNVSVSFRVPTAAMPASIDREMLHRVLRNVLRNAAQALRDASQGKEPPWGRIEVSAEVDAKGYVIVVDDDGPGIRDDVKSGLFDPYVTTKRDGTGLGLSIVKKIIVDHGGAIEAEDGPLGGARFRITLPRPDSPEARAAAWRSTTGRSEPAGPPSSR
jgi:two-component system, NtrC family, nitrogen regulation sensor histidine kinase NtrY